MQRTRLCRILVLAFFLFLILTEFSFAQSRSGPSQKRKAADGEVLVRFRDLPPTSLAGMAQSYDLSLSQPLGRVPRLYRLKSRSRKVEELVSALAALADVLYAEPNVQYSVLELPNDPQFAAQWALHNTGQSAAGFPAGTPGADISAVSAWDISTGGTTHVVGIVDTGIDYTHPDLQANIWSAPTDFTITLNGVSVTCLAGTHGFNAITGTCDPMDDHMHGTHVSGIIGAAGNNDLGVVGVNWSTQMMGLKFLNSQGSGYASDAVTAIEFAIQTKEFFSSTNAADVRVLSNSWGGSGFSQALQDEINEAAKSDILFVAAAGNSSANSDLMPMYPASFGGSNMISVAATDNNDALAYFSNYGLNSVNLGAPGVDVLSTLLGGTYGYLSGTSMATPYVSGAAALMLSVCSLSTTNLKKNLLDNVDLIPALSGITTSGGRLNVNHALVSCIGPVGLSPIALTFGAVAVGQSSAPKILTLTNYQTIPLNLSNILASGDFSQTNNCGVTLAPSTSCTITAVFNPSSTGNRTGQIQVFDDAANSPQTATLAGTATLDIDLVASTSISLNVTSPGSAIPANSVVTNQGTAAAGASIAGVYLSLTGLRDNTAVPVGSFNVPALPGGASVPAQTSVTIPSNLALGSYYVLTCADDTNLVVETNEANNCGAAATVLQVQAASLPDLIESSVSFVQQNAQTLQVTDAVTNRGTVNAIASVTQFYMSSSGSKDATAYQLIGSRSVPALAVGTGSQGVTTVQVPQNMPSGTYYLLACADDTNLVPESNETNNCTAAFSKVQFLADLVESAVSSQTLVAWAGSTLVVSDIVTDQGGAAAGPSVTQYYLSPLTNKAANGARLLGGSRSVPALAPGASSMGSASVTVPQDMATGTFYLLACADDTNLVPESNETNNCSAASARIQVGPDLTESAVSSQALVTGAGGAITVTDTANNVGAGYAAASFTQYYLSPLISKTANGSRLLAGNRSVPALASGTSSTGTASVAVPSDMATGTFYLLACADDTNLVPETNENNNCAAASARIQVGPDLIESGVSSQTVLTGPGVTITVSDTATNQGGGNAATSLTQYYLSPLISKTANGSRLLTGNRAVPALASGTSSTGTAKITVPSDMATETFYLLACADDTNLVPENNENNNCAAAPTRVRVSQ